MIMKITVIAKKVTSISITNLLSKSLEKCKIKHYNQELTILTVQIIILITLLMWKRTVIICKGTNNSYSWIMKMKQNLKKKPQIKPSIVFLKGSNFRIKIAPISKYSWINQTLLTQIKRIVRFKRRINNLMRILLVLK